MKIAIGADHGGYKLKKQLVKYLEARGCLVADLGTHSARRCDYPPFGQKVAQAVSGGNFSRGILVCKTGIGMAMVANKFPGIRAALCQNPLLARRSREHNNANILVLASNYLSIKEAQGIVAVWLRTKFSGGRHARRVRQITNIERKIGRENEKLKTKNAKPKLKIQNF